MKLPTKTELARLRDSGLFDPDWYRRMYGDVDMLGMDPAEHYLKYGFRIGRDPGPELSSVFVRTAYRMRQDHEPIARLRWLEKQNGGKAEPERANVLLAAHTVAQQGDHDRAIALAERHLPADLAYTAHILRANAAIAFGKEDGWLASVNAYLGHFGVSPVTLDGSGTIFDRLSSTPLPAVTGGPLISVIMPAWNAGKTVRKAAQSILNQTWRNLELLIVDDCSTDDTWTVLQEIAAADSRVKIRRNTVNVGPYVSKNLALTDAKGEWITGQDADDWSLPERLERHVALAREAEAPASLTFMLRFRPDGLVEHFSPMSMFSPDGVARISSISTLFRSDLLRDKLGYWDSVRFSADSEMIERTRRMLGDRFREFGLIGMLCLDSETGLTRDPQNGIHTATGLSPIRQAYKKSWMSWLADYTDNEALYLPLLQDVRRYAGASSMVVPLEQIQSNMASPKTGNEEKETVGYLARDDASHSEMDNGTRASSEVTHCADEGLEELSDFLFKHIPALVQPVEHARFGERAREWSWRWGYWGRAAGLLFLTTRDEKYLRLLDEAHDAFLAVRDDRLGLVDDVRHHVLQSWGTVISGKYDRGLRACEVESSGLMVLPWVDLLFADSEGLVPEKIRQKWMTTIDEVIAAHSNELVSHAASGGGYFMSPWFDHKVEPLNHSHLFGAACALSYGISGNESHRDIALHLYRFFRYNWRSETNSLVSWAYNPTETDKCHGPAATTYGDRNHKVLMGPELFYKAAVSIELPVAMFRAGILPGNLGELQNISKSIRKSVFEDDLQINYYISQNKRHLCSEPDRGNMPVLRPHYMCGFELLGNVDQKMSEQLALIVENRLDFFPKKWLTGPASVMAQALRFSRKHHSEIM